MFLYRPLVILLGPFHWASVINGPGSVRACVWFMGADRNSIYRLGSTACYSFLQIKAKIKKKKHIDKQRFHFLQLGLNVACRLF